MFRRNEEKIRFIQKPTKLSKERLIKKFNHMKKAAIDFEKLADFAKQDENEDMQIAAHKKLVGLQNEMGVILSRIKELNETLK